MKICLAFNSVLILSAYLQFHIMKRRKPVAANGTALAKAGNSIPSARLGRTFSNNTAKVQQLNRIPNAENLSVTPAFANAMLAGIGTTVLQSDK